MSDMLVARSVAIAPRGHRWTDYADVPAGSAVAKEFSLVWEMYDLDQRSGNASYDVALTFVRGRSAAGRITAKITGALSSLVRREQTDDRVTQRLTRSVAYAPELADAITLQLSDTPPGTYTLTLEITDKLSGKAATRTRQIVVRR
jgi:hypothetical protein